MSPDNPAWITTLENLARGLPVLLVEGSDDVRYLGYFFEQHFAGYGQCFTILNAGNKKHVFC